VLFADPFAIPSSGVVAVREYGSSPRRRPRSGSTKITALLWCAPAWKVSGEEREDANPPEPPQCGVGRSKGHRPRATSARLRRVARLIDFPLKRSASTRGRSRLTAASPMHLYGSRSLTSVLGPRAKPAWTSTGREGTSCIVADAHVACAHQAAHAGSGMRVARRSDVQRRRTCGHRERVADVDPAVVRMVGAIAGYVWRALAASFPIGGGLAVDGEPWSFDASTGSPPSLASSGASIPCAGPSCDGFGSTLADSREDSLRTSTAPSRLPTAASSAASAPFVVDDSAGEHAAATKPAKPK
jgi:hypothetical protein